MNDINGVELSVGDKIIYSQYNNADLQKGEIFKISKSVVTVKYAEDYCYTTGMGVNAKVRTVHRHNQIRSSSQILKVG